MEKKVLSSFFFFFFLFGFGFSQNPGISINITASGVQHFQSIVDPMIYSMIKTLEPIKLGPQPYSTFDVTLNATKLVISQINFTEPKFMLVSDEIEIYLTKLEFLIDYDLTYEVTFPPLSGKISGTAKINQTTISVFLQFESNNGKPKLMVDSKRTSLDIGYIDTGLPGFLGTLTRYFENLLESTLDRQIPSSVIPLVNDYFKEQFGNLSMKYYLDPENKTVLDYSLLGNPKISNSGISIDLKGDVYAIEKRNTCPFQMPEMPKGTSKDVQLSLSQGVLQCALFAVAEGGVLADLANGLIQGFLHLDGRIGFQINFPEISSVLFSPSGIDALIGMEVLFDVPSEADTVFVHVSVNISVELGLLLSSTAGNLSILIDISDVKTSIFVDPSQIGSGIPEKYREEILKTNFTELGEQADQFINSTVLPAVREQLKNGISIPPTVSQYLQNPILKVLDKYLFIATDLINPNSKREGNRISINIL